MKLGPRWLVPMLFTCWHPVVLCQNATSPPTPIKGPRVCVADVANSSMQPIFTDRLKARLVEDLQKEKVNVYNAYAATVLANQLGISADNKAVMRREKCDYMLLSEVVRPKAQTPGQAEDAKADIGTKPSGDQLAIHFGLFKKGKLLRPALAKTVTLTPAADPTAAALTGMDEVAKQIVEYFPRH